MNRYLTIIFAISALLISCNKKVENPLLSDTLPDIFPDYMEVTIPVDMAPMNFSLTDETVECIDVVARGNKGGEMHVQGAFADFDVEKWHQLTRINEGGHITFTVCVLKDEKWIQYQDFKMYVSTYHLDDYGITYRRIAPGYEVGGNMGIYQRDIHTFDETAILQESAVPGQCMNCHTANRCNPDQYLLHLRGSKGGTIIHNKGTERIINTRSDQNTAHCGYSYWHPDGRYVAATVNNIYQLFYTGSSRRIEAFDTRSDIVILDTQTDKVKPVPHLQTDAFETYPVFSADGTRMYFCTSPFCEMPYECEQSHFSLCSATFDAKTGEVGTDIDTLINAMTDNTSVSHPRPSFDGKWLMYCKINYGYFPVNHKEADLWLLNLSTGHTRPLVEVNSPDVDSFHNWSSSSHWFVFSSRREDGLFCNAYLSCIDAKGRATKPFLLPQRNPRKYYGDMFESFNCPEFITSSVALPQCRGRL